MDSPLLPIETPADFGNEVRRQRMLSELTQAELAERAGVSRQWLSRLERGHTRAELGAVLRVLRCTGRRLPGTERLPGV